MIARETTRVAPLVAYELDREAARGKLTRLTYTEDQVLGSWLPETERPG